MLARGSQSQSSVDNNIKDSKLLLTEVMSLVLKPTKDHKMHQAYVECFISLTKQFNANNDPQMDKFVSFTYK
jgi:hypothetical protein